MHRLVIMVCIALAAGACGSETPPPDSLDQTGILLVGVGDRVQAAPSTEALKVAFSEAAELAEVNGEDLGYPWFDPSLGELVLSAVTPRGRILIEEAGIRVPHRIRDVAHGVAELQRIQHAATFLHTQGVPGAELIYSTTPDHRDNRTLIVI